MLCQKKKKKNVVPTVTVSSHTFILSICSRIEVDKLLSLGQIGPCFSKIVLWTTATAICLPIVYACFCTITAKMSNYYKDQMAWKTEIFISGPLQKVLTDPCSRKSTPLFFHLFTMGCLHLPVSLPKMTFPHLTSNIFCQSCSSHYLEEADPTPKQNKITFPVVLLYSFPHRPYHDGITLIIWVLIFNVCLPL